MEILTPKADAGPGPKALERFGRRYRKIAEFGCAAAIPDNPFGVPRTPALDALDRLGIPIEPGGLLMTVNTFHSKDELSATLRRAADAGVEHLLAVRGDGSPSLPRLAPADMGLTGGPGVVTSADLIWWIHREFPGRFVVGAAYNQYKPERVERSRLRKKVEAGAGFVVTQPALGRDPALDALSGLDVPVVIEAWMSRDLELLRKSVRADALPVYGGASGEGSARYDPAENLRDLHLAFPGNRMYLSMLDFDADWRALLPNLF